MSDPASWSSQPLDNWALKYAPGKFVDLEGKATHYIEKGSGEPLILLHGFFFDTYMWQLNIDALAEHFHVFAIDLWGFGYSTRQPLDYGYKLFSRQLGLFMDAKQIPRAHLMGQSMGGGTIVQFTVDHPDRVGKIVLVDPAGMPNPLPIMGRISNLPGLGELMYLLPGNFIRRMTLGTTFLHRKNRISDELLESLMRFHKIEGTHRVMLKVTRSMFFDTLQDKIEALSQLDLPILIFWGRQEKSIPLETGKKWPEILGQAEFEILDLAGHCPNLDQPTEFNQLALKFLKG